MCEVFSVHPSGYYAWVRRRAKGLSEDDRQLLLAMREIHRQEKRRAGSRRIVKKLKERNLHVGRHRVRRLMREDGMIAKRTRAWRNPSTTDSNHDQPIADNLVNRNFSPEVPNAVWSCDIT